MMRFVKRVDAHKCMHLVPLVQPDQASLAAEIKEASLQGLRALWLVLKSDQLHWAQCLVTLGFTMHRCNKQQLYFNLKLKQCSIPQYSGMSLGCGCICVRQVEGEEQILLVRQAGGPRKGFLGLPGGMADRGEGPIKGGLRELKQQTGLEGQFQYIYSIRYADKLYFQQDDLYVCSVFKLKQGQEIKLQKQQISEHKWINVSKLGEVLEQTMGTGRLVLTSLAERAKGEKAKLLNQDLKNGVMRSKMPYSEGQFGLQLITLIK